MSGVINNLRASGSKSRLLSALTVFTLIAALIAPMIPSVTVYAAAPAGGWPASASFTTIATDPSSDSTCSNRDLTTISYTQDSNYWYFRFNTVGNPTFLTAPAGCDRTLYKIGLDTNGDGAINGGGTQLLNSEYILVLTDTNKSPFGLTLGSPRLYLVPSVDYNNFGTSHELTSPNGYFEVTTTNITMAVKKTVVTSLQKIYVYSDTSVKNLDQISNSPGLDKYDNGGAPIVIVVPPPPTENTLAKCTNGTDDDGDGLIDILDPDCATFKPKLAVIKMVTKDNGGTLDPLTVPLFIDGVAVMSGATTTLNTIGSHTVTETNPVGYVGTFSGDCNVSGVVSIAMGEAKTCILTNDDVAPTIKVDVSVTSDNGGPVNDPNSVIISLDGSPITNGAVNSVNAGAHIVGLTTPSGYTATFGGSCNSSGNVSVVVGDVKTCTITLNDIAPILTIIKNVIANYGGSILSASGFTMNVTATNPSLASFPGSAGTVITVDAGSYSVDEGANSAYTKTLDANCSGTIAVGETKTCTVTNTQNQIPEDTNALCSDGIDNDGDGQIDLSDSDCAAFVPVENTLALCSDTIDNDGDGMIDENDADCATFLPKVNVVLNVTNDNGGTTPNSGFTVNVTGTNPSLTSFPGSAGTMVTFKPGAYTVDASATTGYAKTLSADCSNTLVMGDSKTCTIGEDDIAPTLQVNVTVNGGGPKTLVDLPASIDTTAVTSGTANSEMAGSHTVSATVDATYPAVIGGDCAVDGTITLGVGDVKTCSVTYTYTPAPTEDTLALCSDSIDNETDGKTDLLDDDCNAFRPTLTVIKHVINNNGATGVAGDFTLNVNGPAGYSGSMNGSETGNVLTFTGTGSYAVTEQTLGRYNAIYSPDCTGTLAIDQDKTCTVTNDDISDTPSAPPAGGGGGGGQVLGLVGSTGGAGGSSGGQVLGAFISAGQVQDAQGGSVPAQQAVLGAFGCTEYISNFMRRGFTNDPEQVKKLQTFLNEELGAGLPVTGFYGPLTEAQVNKFQLKYSGDVLTPWVNAGLHASASEPTGITYLSTRWKINKIKCPELNAAFPALTLWSGR